LITKFDERFCLIEELSVAGKKKAEGFAFRFFFDLIVRV